MDCGVFLKIVDFKVHKNLTRHRLYHVRLNILMLHICCIFMTRGGVGGRVVSTCGAKQYFRSINFTVGRSGH